MRQQLSAVTVGAGYLLHLRKEAVDAVIRAEAPWRAALDCRECSRVVSSGPGNVSTAALRQGDLPGPHCGVSLDGWQVYSGSTFTASLVQPFPVALGRFASFCAII